MTLPPALADANAALPAALADPGATVHARQDTRQVVVSLTVEAAMRMAGRLAGTRG